MTAVVFLLSLLALIALGMPIAFALMFSGVALMLVMGQFDAQIVVQNAIAGADNFVLMAVPFFILAGEFMNAGGLSRRIVDMASAFVGHLRGGLAMAAVMLLFATLWTIAQVAAGGRWVEVGTATGGYAAAAPLVSFAGLAFDVVVEIVIAYVPFLALAVGLGLMRDPRPLAEV